MFDLYLEQLTPSDTDSAGDIYDVRVDGGFPPPPPRPVECEGDACSTPGSAPTTRRRHLLPAGAPAAETSKPPTTVKKKTSARTRKRKQEDESEGKEAQEARRRHKGEDRAIFKHVQKLSLTILAPLVVAFACLSAVRWVGRRDFQQGPV